MDRRSLLPRWPAVAASLIVLSILTCGCKSALKALPLYQRHRHPSRIRRSERKNRRRRLPAADRRRVQHGRHRPGIDRENLRSLKHNVKEIHLIDSQKVANLLDEKGVDDYLEIGRTLKADKVVGIDIESFSDLDGQTLFRGRATVHIKVYDVADKQVEWRKSPPQFEWPRIGSKPATDCNEVAFRNEFIDVLAEQIARYFYPHDRYEDSASDSLSMH